MKNTMKLEPSRTINIAYLYTMIEREARHQDHDRGKKDERYGYGPQVLEMVVYGYLIHEIPEDRFGLLVLFNKPLKTTLT